MRARTTVAVATQGRIVVPKPVRDRLELEDGDLIEIDISKIGD